MVSRVKKRNVQVKNQKKVMLLVGESNPGRPRDRRKCYQLHQPGNTCFLGPVFFKKYVMTKTKQKRATPVRFELTRAKPTRFLI